MFVESELTWKIAVKPSDLKSGLHIQRALLRKLLADFDKLKCSEKHGYYICVTTLEGIGEGKIWEGKGCVAYEVRFRCLTYKPQKYEKVFAVVRDEPKEKGVICSYGPIEEMFMSTKHMKDQYTFIGASETKPAHFKCSDGSVIERGSVLRVEIIGVKYDSFARVYITLCSVSGHYLGTERRTWEDKSKPQAAAGGDGDWGTTMDANGNGTEGWGCDTHAENGGEGWGAGTPQKGGGWAAATAEKTNSIGTWDALPSKDTGGWDDVPAKKADSGKGWDSAPAKKAGKGSTGGWDADVATESTGGWDYEPTKEINNGEGWNVAPAVKSRVGEAFLGKQNSASAKENVDSGNADSGEEDARGWGSSAAKKSKVGGWDSWSDPPPKASCGAWDAVEVETTGGGWGD